MSHEVSCESATCPALTPEWMNQSAFTRDFRSFNEPVNLFNNFPKFIKQNLIVLVIPEICQILNSNVHESVIHLQPSTVHNPGYLIVLNKLQVLRGEIITYEQPVFDFYGPNHLKFAFVKILFHDFAVYFLIFENLTNFKIYKIVI